MEDLGVYDFTYKDFSIFDAVSKLPEKYKAVILLITWKSTRWMK